MTFALKTRRSTLPILLATTLYLIVLAAFTALQYHLPAHLDSMWRANRHGVDHFASALFRGKFSEFSDHDFRQAFRVLLTALYLSYAALLLALRKAPPVKAGKALAAVAIIAVAIAVLFPPSLSSDLYAYIAYARLPFHHLNPYFHSPQAIIDAGEPVSQFLARAASDPTRRRIGWDIPTVYGPVWTLLSLALVAVCGYTHLWGAAVGMKLIEGAALILAAASAGRIARTQLGVNAEGAAILTIGLNPLALIEGAGSGHNDLLMIALALLAIACLYERRPGLAGLALGLSVGVKFITLALLPWLLVEFWKRREGADARRGALAIIGGTIAPIALCYAPFWHGVATLSALSSRTTILQTASHIGGVAALHAHPSGLLAALRQHGSILILYAISTAFVVFARIREAWAPAWMFFSVALIYFVMGIWFPWYLLWTWLMALASGLQTPAKTLVIFSIGVLSLTLSIFYSVTPGPMAIQLLGLAICLCACLLFVAFYAALKAPKKKW